MGTFVTIIAIIAGPILAVRAQKLIERISQKHEEKRRLFMTLMATRGRPLIQEHVQALNMIDVIFSDKGIVDYLSRARRKKNREVVEAWSELRDHLYNFPRRLPVESDSDGSKVDKVTYDAQFNGWASKKDDLLVELLAKMAESLNYHFDKVILKRGSYTPQGYGETEAQQWIILRGLSEVFLGMKSIPIRVVEPSDTKAKESSQEASPETPEQGAQ